MKLKKLRTLCPAAVIATGVFLGRGAHADTVVDFDSLPDGQDPNVIIIQSFGDNATNSSNGVTVTGFGTPNIDLTWGGIGYADTQWEPYLDAVWTAGQLNDSAVGTSHTLKFTPNSASARVVVKSFNFHPYYNRPERYTYNVSLLSGTNVLVRQTNINVVANESKQLVSINYTGAVGQTLKLKLDRLPSALIGDEVEGENYSIAVDDITFAQLPATVFAFGPQVVTNTPADDSTVAGTFTSYSASITNGNTTVVGNSIQLKLDGVAVSPPPTISSSGGLTNVTYQGSGLLSAGTHFYTLTYADNLGAFYTNDAVFNVNYATLPTAYAIPSGAGVVRGFTARSVSASLEATNNVVISIARAKAQLAGTLTNSATMQPYTNSAELGPNPDGSFNYDTVVNFADEGTTALGNFPEDVLFPGLPSGPYENFTTEAVLYLQLAAGYYRFGVNSDDGFEVAAEAPAGVSGSPVVLGLFDSGRGADNTLFDFLVQTNGIYKFKLIFFEIGGFANVELFSVNLTNSQFTLINDTNASAIVSYRVLKPLFTSIARSGGNVVLNWAFGTPPFQVQFKTNVTDTLWNNVGSTTSNRTATFPMQSSSGFYRVCYVQP